MDPSPTLADIDLRMKLLEIQCGTILWLSGLNLIANVATIIVAFIAASGGVR